MVEPPLPDGIADVGMRLEPNLEVVQALAPDLILIAPGLEAVRARLESIAPTLRLQVFTPGKPAFPAAIAETRRLGQLLQRKMKRQPPVLLSGSGSEAAVM